MWDILEKIYIKSNTIIKNKTRMGFLDMAGILAIFGVAAIMVLRAFFGSELTDEVYYVSNTMSIIHGNIPVAYNNDTLAFGSYLLLAPQLWLYEKLVPDLEGIFLFTRLSFLVFKLIILFFIFRFIKSESSPVARFLCFAFMIPYSGGIITNNYSYNSVGALLALLVGILLYDTIEKTEEGKAKHIKIRLIIAGFLSAWLVFSHTGYAVAVILFMLLIIVRTKGKAKVFNELYYCLGGIIGIIVVLLPLILMSDLDLFISGFMLYISPYPEHSMSLNTWSERIVIILEYIQDYFIIWLAVFFVASYFVWRYVRRDGEEYTKTERICISLQCAYIICSIVSFFTSEYEVLQMVLGILTAVFMILLFISGILKKASIVYYISVYPIIFAWGMAILTGSNYAPSRFIAVLPGFIGCAVILSKHKNELIRLLNGVSLLMVVAIIGYAQCKFVYRDDFISELNTRVERGVYKGIYTTPARARDLPELEDYLNGIVTDGETYACRDNVPFAYLMIHDGTMVEINTWDSLQYSYELNEPAKMYAYYERRDMIPEKIIYIDFGRDDNLSIEDENYRYNDWVEEYYSKDEDVVLNETFFHIVDYQYDGGFDGNYDYWIEKYMGLAED